jgi:hypothetical protein
MYPQSYTKMIQWELFWRFEITILRFIPLLFLYQSRYKIFSLAKKKKIQNILNWDFALLWDTTFATFRILFQNFLKLVNIIFQFFYYAGALELGRQKPPLVRFCCSWVEDCMLERWYSTRSISPPNLRGRLRHLQINILPLCQYIVCM